MCAVLVLLYVLAETLQVARCANTTWFDIVSSDLYDSTYARTVESLRLYGAYGFDDPNDPYHDDTGGGNTLNITGNYSYQNHSFFGGYLALESDARIRFPVPSTPIAPGDCISATVLVRIPISQAPSLTLQAVANNNTGLPLLTCNGSTTLGAKLQYPHRGGLSIDFCPGLTQGLANQFGGIILIPFANDTWGKFVPLTFTLENVDNNVTKLVIGTALHMRTYTQSSGRQYPTISVREEVPLNTLLSQGVFLGGLPLHIASVLFTNDYDTRTAILFNTHAQRVPAYVPPSRTSPAAYYDFESGSMENRVEGSHIGPFAQRITVESKRYLAGRGKNSPAYYDVSSNSTQNYSTLTNWTVDDCLGNANGACHRGLATALWTTSGGIRYTEYTYCFRTRSTQPSGVFVYHAPTTTMFIAADEVPNGLPRISMSHTLYEVLGQGNANTTKVAFSQSSYAVPITVPRAWTHTCMVLEPNGSGPPYWPSVALYVNGTLVGRRTPFDQDIDNGWDCCSSDTTPYPWYRMSINEYSYDPTRYFMDHPYPELADLALPTSPQSYTDDVALYAYALNASEIAYLASIQTTLAPTQSPGYVAPSASPTDTPTGVLTDAPGATPYPTLAPTRIPTVGPTPVPTSIPTATPTAAPTGPSSVPTSAPSAAPSAKPTSVPSGTPSSAPSASPSVATSAPTFIPSVSPTPFTATAPLNQTLVVPSSTWVQSLLRVVSAAPIPTASGQGPAPSASLAFTARANGSFLSRAFSPRTPGAATESGCSPDLPGAPILGFHVWPVDVYTPFPSPLYVSVDPSGLPFDASMARVAQCVQQTWELRDAATLPVEVASSLLPDAPIVVALSVPGISVLVLASAPASSSSPSSVTTCASGRHGCACTRTSSAVASDLPLYTTFLILGATLGLATGLAGILTDAQLETLAPWLAKKKAWLRTARVVLPVSAAAFLVTALALFPASEYSPSTALVSRTRAADGSVARDGDAVFLAAAYLVAAACAALALVAIRAWGANDAYHTLVQATTRTMAGVALVMPSTALTTPSMVSAVPVALTCGGGVSTLFVNSLGARYWPSYRKTVVALWLVAMDLFAYATLVATWRTWPCETSYYGDTRV